MRFSTARVPAAAALLALLAATACHGAAAARDPTQALLSWAQGQAAPAAAVAPSYDALQPPSYVASPSAAPAAAAAEAAAEALKLTRAAVSSRRRRMRVAEGGARMLQQPTSSFVPSAGPSFNPSYTPMPQAQIPSWVVPGVLVAQAFYAKSDCSDSPQGTIAWASTPGCTYDSDSKTSYVLSCNSASNVSVLLFNSSRCTGAPSVVPLSLCGSPCPVSSPALGKCSPMTPGMAKDLPAGTAKGYHAMTTCRAANTDSKITMADVAAAGWSTEYKFAVSVRMPDPGGSNISFGAINLVTDNCLATGDDKTWASTNLYGETLNQAPMTYFFEDPLCRGPAVGSTVPGGRVVSGPGGPHLALTPRIKATPPIAHLSVGLAGVFSDAQCRSPYAFLRNPVPVPVHPEATAGKCSPIIGLGSGNVSFAPASSTNFTVTLFTTESCKGSPVTFLNVPMGVCTNASTVIRGGIYLLLAPVLPITQAYNGGSATAGQCTGTPSTVAAPMAAVLGLGGSPVCSTTGAFSVSALLTSPPSSPLLLANVSAFPNGNCSGAPAAVFPGLGPNDCRAAAPGGSGALATLVLQTGAGGASPSATTTATATPTPSRSPSATPTPSKTGTRTSSATPSLGSSVTRTPSAPRTPSRSNTPTPTGSGTDTSSPTVTPSSTPPVTPGASASVTPSNTPSGTPTPSATPPKTRSRTPSRTPSAAVTPGVTPSATSTVSAYPSASMSNLPSSSNSPTPSTTPLPSGAPVSASPSPTASTSPIVAGKTLQVALSLPMPATTGADALAAMLTLITTTWLSLPAATSGAISPFYDTSVYPNVQQGYTFTLLVPKDTAQALVTSYAASAVGARLRRRLQDVADAAAASGASEVEALAASLSATVSAMSTDGSLTTAVASSGLASSMGYDSVDDLMAGLVVPPVAVAQVASASPSPWRAGGVANFTGAFSIGGLPASAFDATSGKLLGDSVAALSAALNHVVAQSCPSCTATILAVADAANPLTSYFSLAAAATRRRLQALPLPASLKVTFEVSGPTANVNTLSAAPPSNFAASLAAKLQADKSWTVSVVLLSVQPASSSNSPPPVNIGAIAGGIVGGVVALGIFFYCWSSRGGPSTKVASSEPTKPKV